MAIEHSYCFNKQNGRGGKRVSSLTFPGKYSSRNSLRETSTKTVTMTRFFLRYFEAAGEKTVGMAVISRNKTRPPAQGPRG